MTKQRKPGARSDGSEPRIILTATEHERLSGLGRAAMNTMPDVAASLVDELDRAHVLAKGRRPIDVVCMGSEVEFRDDTTGRIQKVSLVYPGEADIEQGKISVLTPIGTALIGLAVGQETRNGDLKRLTVLKVREPGL